MSETLPAYIVPEGVRDFDRKSRLPEFSAGLIIMARVWGVIPVSNATALAPLAAQHNLDLVVLPNGFGFHNSRLYDLVEITRFVKDLMQAEKHPPGSSLMIQFTDANEVKLMGGIVGAGLLIISDNGSRILTITEAVNMVAGIYGGDFFVNPIQAAERYAAWGNGQISAAATRGSMLTLDFLKKRVAEKFTGINAIGNIRKAVESMSVDAMKALGISFK